MPRVVGGFCIDRDGPCRTQLRAQAVNSAARPERGVEVANSASLQEASLRKLPALLSHAFRGSGASLGRSPEHS